MKQAFFIAFCLLLSMTRSFGQSLPVSATSPLELTKEGYAIHFGDDLLNQAAAQNVRVDVALVDFTGLSRARNAVDSMAFIEKVYQDPSRFYVVTGVLTATSASEAKLITKARFGFSIADKRYTMVVVDNDGNDNSGTKKAPERFYKKKGSNCTCTSCGCCCYRTTRGCTYCGIVIKR